MVCEKCGHDHDASESCRSSFCKSCGTGGDLTTVSCTVAKETNLKIEHMIRVMEKTGKKSITWEEAKSVKI